MKKERKPYTYKSKETMMKVRKAQEQNFKMFRLKGMMSQVHSGRNGIIPNKYKDMEIFKDLERAAIKAARWMRECDPTKAERELDEYKEMIERSL